jgi:hypothetical protein
VFTDNVFRVFSNLKCTLKKKKSSDRLEILKSDDQKEYVLPILRELLAGEKKHEVILKVVCELFS